MLEILWLSHGFGAIFLAPKRGMGVFRRSRVGMAGGWNDVGGIGVAGAMVMAPVAEREITAE